MKIFFKMPIAYFFAIVHVLLLIFLPVPAFAVPDSFSTDSLLAATVIAGGEKDEAWAIDVDSNGNVFIAGKTDSINFAVAAAGYDGSYNGATDAFILKFDQNLKNLLSATLLGGDRFDEIEAIHVSDSGNVFVAGYTKSNNLPVTANAYDKIYNGSLSDAFIAKFDNDLSDLLACTYIGGSNDFYDTIFVLMTDDQENVYVAGDTRASDFPTLSKNYDNTYNGGETDGFVAKFDKNLSTLKASTFLGGSEADFIYAMTFDNREQNVFVAGRTTSPDLPTTSGAYKTEYADDDDGFIAKFDDDLENLKALTYLNGESDGEDEVYGIAVDSKNNIYVTGNTSSTDFPQTSGAYDTEYNGSGDVFVSKLSSDLKTLMASTLIGGEQNDEAYGLGIDSSGMVFVTGWTYNPYGGEDFPVTSDAFDKTFNGAAKDVFFSVFDNNLSDLIYSTLLGGDDIEETSDLAIGSSGNVFVTGFTESTDFPVTNDAYQMQLTEDSRENIFVVSFNIPENSSDNDGSDENDSNDVDDSGGGGGGGGGGGCFVTSLN